MEVFKSHRVPEAMRKDQSVISSVSVLLLLSGIVLSGQSLLGAPSTRSQKAAAAYHRAERSPVRRRSILFEVDCSLSLSDLPISTQHFGKRRASDHRRHLSNRN